MANYFRIISKRRIVTLLVVAALVVTSAVSAQETITFPARSANLATDSYWTVSEFSEGCCTLDLNVMRWTGSNWTGQKSGGKNSDDYTWNVPLYAPANGVIAACWRNSPDNAEPGNKDKYREGNIFTCGNYITIITDEGNSIGLCHLKQGSIPVSLCPSNSDNQTYPESATDKQDGWHDASYIEPANRPRIREGQYLGRAGNSGNSGGPHLHISMREINGTAASGREIKGAKLPLVIRNAWAHPYEKSDQHKSGGWYRLRGTEFKGSTAEDCKEWKADAPHCKFKTLHPSPYLRRTDKSAGAIKFVETLFISDNRAVTAVVLESGNNLKLIAWDLVGVNSIVRKGDITVGQIKEVHLSEPASNYVLAAVRLMDNTLKMIAFKVTATGGFARVADKVAGKISALDMATTKGWNRKAVTAVRLLSSGNLKVIAWDIDIDNSGNASIVRLGEANAGAVSALSISQSRNFYGVFTAVRTNGNLRVIPWVLSSNGKVFTRRAHFSHGAIAAYVDVAPLAHGVAVAVQNPDGQLNVLTWSVNRSGDIGLLHGSRFTHETSQFKLLTAPNGGSNLTTVLRSEAGNLYLVGWGVDDYGRNLRRLGSSRAGAISALSADVVSRSYTPNDPRDMILTAVRLSKGNLKLITWDTNLVNP